jgi:hypothetical protein
MSEQHSIDYLLTVNIEPSYTNLRRLELILYRNMNYLKRLTGREDVAGAVSMLQNLIMWLRMAQIALRAFQMASGPVGWAYFATTAIGLAFTTGDMLLGMGE